MLKQSTSGASEAEFQTDMEASIDLQIVKADRIKTDSAVSDIRLCLCNDLHLQARWKLRILIGFAKAGNAWRKKTFKTDLGRVALRRCHEKVELESDANRSDSFSLFFSRCGTRSPFGPFNVTDNRLPCSAMKPPTDTSEPPTWLTKEGFSSNATLAVSLLNARSSPTASALNGPSNSAMPASAFFICHPDLQRSPLFIRV